MKLLASVSNPTKPKTANSKTIALMLAGVFVIFAVTQLFNFDEFIKIVFTYGIFNDEITSKIKAVLLVVAEVFALPFLLRMRVSWLMRIVSMVCGWLVILFWLVVCVWLVIGKSNVVDIGFLGGIVELMPGWWAVLLSLGLGILSAWASWGMWPVRAKKLPASR